MTRSKLVTVGVGAVVAGVLAFLAHGALRPDRAPIALSPASRDLGVATRAGTIRNLAKPPGKLLVLHFWATWCPPCVEEMPGLLAYARDIAKDPSMELLTVSVDEDWKTVDEWLKARGASDLPVALDAKRRVATLMGTEKFPETYVIAEDGRILGQVKGPVDWSSKQIRTQIEDFRNQKSAGSGSLISSS